MPEYDAFSAHQDIDEEIDELLRARHLSPGDLCLIDDLGALLREDDTGTDEESLQRVLHRLLASQQAGQKAGSQSMSPVAFSQRRQQSERPLFMYNTSLPQATKKRRFPGVFTALAAMLVVALLVGGMLLAVRVVHQGGAAAPGTLVKATPTLVPKPTPLPEPEGSVIYKSGEISFILPPVWSPNGKRLAGALNTTLESWDALTGKNRLTYAITLSGTNTTISSVSWSPDSNILAATVRDTIYLFNARNTQLIRTVIASSPLSSASDPLPVVQRNGVTPLSSRIALSGANYLTNVAWSPDGKKIAAGYSGVWHGMQQLVFVWNASTGTLLKTLSTNLVNIASVNWSPRGDKLVVQNFPGGDTSVAQIWSTTSWNLEKTYPRVDALAWSPDESLLAFGQNTSMKIVNTATDQTVRQLSLEIGTDSLQWFPDNTRLLISGSGEIQVWNASSGQHISTLPYHHSDTTSEVQLSPDGSYISCILVVGTGTFGTANFSVKYYQEVLAA